MTLSMTSGPTPTLAKAGLSLPGAVATSTTDAAAAEKAKLEKTAKAFEAVFVRQLIGSMRKASLGDDDLTGSSAVEQFQELADAKTADAMSERGSLGIAEMLLSRLTPKAATPPTAGATTLASTTGATSGATAEKSE